MAAHARKADEGALVWLGRCLACLIVGFGLYAAFTSIDTIYRFGSPGLYFDQWELVDKLMHSAGSLSLTQIWAQHNEHRVPIAWLSGLIDLRLFGGRNNSLFAGIVLTQLALVALIVTLFNKFGRFRGRGLVTVAGFALFCALCPLQMENFVWGFQLAFVLTGLAVAAAFAGALWHSAIVTVEPRRWVSAPLLFAFGAAFLAECGLAAGLLAWPILLWLGYVLRFPRKTQILTAAVALTAGGAYFIGYDSPPKHSIDPAFVAAIANPRHTLQHPVALAEYVITYFGATWDSQFHSASMPALSTFLIAIVLLSVLSYAGRLAFRRDGKASSLPCWLAANMLFAILTALLTSLGRVSFGIAQAGESRYQTIALLFWVSFAGMILALVATRPWRQVGLVVVQGVLVLLMWADTGQFNAMVNGAKAQKAKLAQGYAALSDHGDTKTLGLIGTAASLPGWYAYLRAHSLGPDASEVTGTAHANAGGQQ